MYQHPYSRRNERETPVERLKQSPHPARVQLSQSRRSGNKRAVLLDLPPLINHPWNLSGINSSAGAVLLITGWWTVTVHQSRGPNKEAAK